MQNLGNAQSPPPEKSRAATLPLLRAGLRGRHILPAEAVAPPAGERKSRRLAMKERNQKLADFVSPSPEKVCSPFTPACRRAEKMSSGHLWPVDATS